MKKIRYTIFSVISMFIGIGLISAKECVTCGTDSLPIPAQIPKFVSGGITFLQILIPVILILVGMVQFMKAMASGEDKTQRDAVSSFIRSIVAGVVIFLVVALVKFVFINFLGSDGADTVSCISCFMDSDTCIKSTCPDRDSSVNPTTISTPKKDCSDYVVTSEGCPSTSESGQSCKTVATSGSSIPSCKKACSMLSSSECSSRSDCSWRASGNSGSLGCYDK